jgi:hypothetical protein
MLYDKNRIIVELSIDKYDNVHYYIDKSKRNQNLLNDNQRGDKI